MTPASLSAETAIQTQTLQLKMAFRPPNALGVAMSSCLRMPSMPAMDRSPQLPGPQQSIMDVLNSGPDQRKLTNFH